MQNLHLMHASGRSLTPCLPPQVPAACVNRIKSFLSDQAKAVGHQYSERCRQAQQSSKEEARAAGSKHRLFVPVRWEQ